MKLSQAHSRRLFGVIGLLQIAIIVLVVLTATIHLQTISIIDKLAEITLIILLLIDDRQSVRSRRSEVLYNAPSQ